MTRIISILILLFAVVAQAQLVEHTYKGSSTKQTPNSAQDDIYQQAIKSTTLELIRAEIGDSAVKANMHIIENQIIPSHARFIPFLTANGLQGDSGKYHMNVRLRVSLGDLRALIRENNLLVGVSKGLPLMVHMVRFTDRISHKQSTWWANNHGDASALLLFLTESLENSLASSMGSAHFYALKPNSLGLRPMVPQAFRAENPRLEDSVLLAQYLDAHLLMAGDVQIRPVRGSKQAELVVRWQGVNTASGRSVADLNRTFKLGDYSNEIEIREKVADILSELATDFATQVEMGWERGTLDASVIQLVVNGKLPLTKHNEFKKSVMDKSKSVKEMKERLFSETKSIFEADISSSTEVLARELGVINLEGISLKLTNVDKEKNTLEFQITK